MASLEGDVRPGLAKGDAPVMVVGGLGVGIKNADPSSSFRPALPTAADTKCLVGVHDYWRSCVKAPVFTPGMKRISRLL
ncbi:hypothetical protein AB0I54_12325 [Streptomyces sp. NPDC050625]|uniref:hypothetical protein n=1 Tax=Streptomyces sp. NPDC050625 TaxID=3154629 RepID=UPI00343ED453